MTSTVQVRSYQRRKPERSPEFRALHNRLVDEVEYMHLSDELVQALSFVLSEAGFLREE
ncbi:MULTISPECIES: hypothetical protein [unclassified Mesorhizobium]|uniref:hypothetical protein n=1 Tax=unclassified Mesorhizobium TaxID=325217 RepID=UPI00167728A1|nr:MULTISPECIES: hypothetical protein [unclassified Mesorhizobium]